MIDIRNSPNIILPSFKNDSAEWVVNAYSLINKHTVRNAEKN